jgi:hypothetical protein
VRRNELNWCGNFPQQRNIRNINVINPIILEEEYCEHVKIAYLFLFSNAYCEADLFLNKTY